MIRRLFLQLAVAATLCVELVSVHADPFRFDQAAVSPSQVELTLLVNDSAELEAIFGLLPGELQLADIGMAVYFSPEWPINPLVAGSVLVSSPTESFNVVTDPNAFGVQYLINAAIAPVLENGAELFSFVINRPSVGTGTVNLWAINLGSGYEIRSEDYGILAQTTVSAVPEPGAYAYMLGGIALVGAMVRRSRKRPS